MLLQLIRSLSFKDSFEDCTKYELRYGNKAGILKLELFKVEIDIDKNTSYNIIILERENKR